jgi:DNA-binding transcriptional ArsR family regulator
VKQLVQVGKAVGHPVRIRILAMLNGRSLCVCQMASVLGLAYPTVSGHLTELRRSGLVIEDKRGKLVFNHLDATSPFAGIVADAIALADRDHTIARDRALVDRVRAVPIPVLTRAGLNLKRLGIVNARPAAESRRAGRGRP